MLPQDAVVSGFAYEGPGELVSAQVLPKEEAIRIYNRLVARIKDPALVEFVGYNLIRTSIFPIEARARQRLVITYEHLLQVQGNIEITIYDQAEVLDFSRPFGVSTDLLLSLCKSDAQNRACLRRWVSCL